jgi:hypothetical protein
MERLFIHIENQTVLWNLIQRSSRWNEFSRVLNQRPEDWFRKCIETQYTHICNNEKRHPTLEISKKGWLLQQNKEAIRIMTADMVSHLSKRPDILPKQSGYNIPSSEKMYNTIEESPTLVYSSSRNYDIPPISAFDMEQERKSKYEKAKVEFEQYQSQYNRLLQPFTPPPPDFSESVPQSKIANMEELLIIQQKMRETDYDMFSPPPPPPSTTNTITNSSELRSPEFPRIPSATRPEYFTTPVKIDTSNTREHIRQEVGQVIGKTINDTFLQIEPDKKTVSWSPAVFTT